MIVKIAKTIFKYNLSILFRRNFLLNLKFFYNKKFIYKIKTITNI